ncbi:MAG: methyltransferase domain-containing protein [Schleiferiaceae bacterium]
MHELKKCPLCGSEHFELELEVKDHMTSKETFSIQKCTDCDFLFTSPRPEMDKIGAYYESDDYISHSNTKKSLFDMAYHMVRNRAIKQKEKLAFSRVSSRGKLLDYGCGTGEFLGHAQTKGWTTLGVEPSPRAAQQAQENQNLKVVSPDDFISDDSISGFDVITMWHVLEHLDDPVEKLKMFNKRLNEGGSLIVAVPNYESLDAVKYGSYWAAWDTPIHFSHFSKKTMKDAASRSGFAVDKIINMPFDSYYVSLLSEKYKGGNPISAMLTGLQSNLAGLKENQSSLIYVLTKLK